MLKLMLTLSIFFKMIKYFIILLVTILLIFCLRYFKKITKRHKIYLNIFIIILFSIPILIYLTTNNLNINKKYIPPKFDGKQIIPGHFNEKN